MLPQGPITSSSLIAAWVWSLAVAILEILLAWYVFKSARHEIPLILDDFKKGTPLKDMLKDYGKYVVVIAMILLVPLIPQKFFGMKADWLGLIDATVNFAKNFGSGLQAPPQ